MTNKSKENGEITALRKYILDYTQLFLVAGIVATLDQLTKHLVRTNLADREILHPEWWITWYVRIIHVSNTGATGGLFANQGWAFVVLSFLMIAVVLYYFPQIPKEQRTLRLALGLILGGGIGNMIDRLARQQVTDFISIGSLPILNLADIGTLLGLAILIITVLLQKRREIKSEPQDSP